MTSQTHTQHDICNPLIPQFGSALHLPIDDLNNWPDLRYRDLTADELAALRLKIAQMVEVVEVLYKQLEDEEAARRADPNWRERPDRLPYVPESIILLIHVPLKLARTMLDERRGDEVAVAHLRLAEGLARQLVTWRGAANERLVEELFGVLSEEPVATSAGEGVYTLPHFFTLEPAERSP